MGNKQQVDFDDKRWDRQLGVTRLILLLLHLIAILLNLQNQNNNIMKSFGSIESLSFKSLQQIEEQFKAASTMALVFTVMQLIILYVGTNRFRVKSTIYISLIHILGICLYFTHNKWQYQNIWNIVAAVSFIPTISEIAIALYTAKI